MDGAVNVEFGHFPQDKWLVNDSLCADGGIPVDLYVQDLVVTMQMLLGPRLSHGNGILRFQMRRIMDHSHFNILPIVVLENTLRDMRSGIINDSIKFLRSVSLATYFPEKVPGLVLEDIGE